MADLPRCGVLHERPFTHEGNYLVLISSSASFPLLLCPLTEEALTATFISAMMSYIRWF